jgi:hypothetical protein
MRSGRFLALLVLLMPSAAAADPVVVAQTDDAYVAHDADAEAWTIGTSGLTFTLSLSSGTLRAVDLRAPRLATPFAIAAARIP